jgi:5-methylcytosine-specific restriction endonuclease McrA
MARDYEKEYREYHSKPEQKKNRAQRNAARREMEEEGRVRKGDGKDVDHKRAIRNGGTNAASNLRITSKSENRGFKRDSRGRPI